MENSVLDNVINSLLEEIKKEKDYGVKDMLLCKLEKLLEEKNEQDKKLLL